MRVAQATKNPALLGHTIPPASDPVWKQAQAILNAAPKGVTPYEVAQYFVTSVPTNFQGAWPEPDPSHPTAANPLIVLFFLSTHTRPAGDTTAWCAAFMNWCLNRGGFAGTSDAGSKSFRDWGTPIWLAADGGLPVNAKAGDIAVFRERHDHDHGHVCFFKAIDTTQPRTIKVVGGNQITAQKLHVIDEKSLRIDGGLELLSVRRKPGLQHV